jgi:beta-galactosidase
MRRLAISGVLILWAAVRLGAASRVTLAFDADWRFLKSDAPGAEKPEFADTDWRAVSLPHDWSIEGPFDRENLTRGAGAFLPAGVGWYRKHFTLSADQARRRVFVEFDGVMANSDVWINGFHLGKRPYGYVGFRYELTGHVKFGRDANVLAVRADNSQQPASRWYAGAGIYRHVRLVLADAVHLETDSIFVTTPKIEAEQATVHVAGGVVNQSDAPRTVSIEIAILGPNGKTVKTGEAQSQTVAAAKSADFQQDLVVRKPDIWDLDHPSLYSALVKVRAGKDTLDDHVAPFGIREFHFDADSGFWLNGRNFKLKGVCLHGDGGAVGTAVPLRVWERRLEQLRQIGVNAIRTAHNPPAPEFLDLCDRMGFVVMDEMFDCWTVAKNPYDYHLYFREWSHIDTRDTVRRDRNHPSIILYSAGNEIHDTPKAELAHEILQGLVEVFHANDPTRPVTQALFRPNVSHDYDNGLADLLDVVGQNYRENEILAAHQAKPTRKIVGTETTHDRRAWLALRDNPPYAGQFLWAGIDYLGEAPGWPAVASYSGLLDKTGGIKPAGWERQSWWSDKPMVHMVRRVAARQASPTDPGYEATRRIPAETLLDDWTPADLGAHQENVEVYSNCEQVELLLNGKSLGAQPLAADASARTWRVAFEPGTLRAVCTNDRGKPGAAYELRTAGKAARIVLSADRDPLSPGWDDLSFVTATVVDENGVTVTAANPAIAFKVEGPGVVAAMDSADNTSHEPFQAAERRAYRGWCIALVRARRAGRIIVSASAEGLAAEPIDIEGR